MLVAVIFKEKTVEIAVGKMGTHPSVKKNLTLDLGEKLYRNGEIKDTHALGKELLIQMKKHKIIPKEIMFAVRSNEIMLTEMAMPIVDKKFFQQTIKVVLEERYPGIAEKNYVAYQLLGMEADSIVAVAAMAPKAMIESYYALAKVMKCRLRKIDLYSSCIAQAVNTVMDKKTDRNCIFIDIDGDFLQIYYISEGAPLVSNSLLLQQTLSKERGSGRTEFLDKLCHSVQAILSVMDEESVKQVFLNNKGNLTSSEIAYIQNELESRQNLKLSLWKAHDKDSLSLAKALLWTPKTFGSRMNFALELNIEDTRNFSQVDAVMAVIAGLSVAAVAMILTVAGYYVWETEKTNVRIVADEAFIQENQEISNLYDKKIQLESELEYVRVIDHYLKKLQYNFVDVNSLVQYSLSVGGSTENSITIGSDLFLNVGGSAASLEDIASIMLELKNQGFKQVRLQMVTPRADSVEGELRNSYDYTIAFRYEILPDEVEVQDSDKPVENGVGS